MGAEVIRYEEPGTGNPLRHGYPPLINVINGTVGPYFLWSACNKKSITGDPDGPPTFMGIAIIDYVTGFMNTYAVQSALFHRERTGECQWIDNSLFDTGTWMLEHKLLHFTHMGEMAWRTGSRGRPMARAYPARDGEVFIIGLFRGGSDR